MTDQTDNVIEMNFRIGKRKPAPRPLQVTSREIEVSGEVYSVHRTVEANGGGFLIVRNPIGQNILVRSSAIPDEYVIDLIMAYRAGESRGRMLGRRELHAEIAREVLT